MDRIGNYFIYCTPLPGSCKEMVTPCQDGYTIYVNDGLTRSERIKAVEHAIRHIESEDFEKSDVQEIESEAHHRGGIP